MTENITTSTRVSVNMKALIAELDSLKPFVATRTNIPVLACVRLTHGDHGLTIHANDLEHWALVTLPATEIGTSPFDFDAVVNYDVFKRILKAHDKDTTVVLDCQVTGERRELIVGGSNGGTAIRSLDPADLPQRQAYAVVKNMTHLRTDETFLTRLAQVRRFTIDDQTRIVLQGVQVKVNGKHAAMAATDSYRAVQVANVAVDVKKGADEKLGTAGMILCNRFIDALVHATKKRASKELDWAFMLPTAQAPGAGELVVSHGDNRYGTRLIDGQFPRMEQLFPDDNAITDTIGFDGEALHEILVSAKKSRGRGKIAKGCVLRGLPGGDAPALTITAKGIDTETTYIVDPESWNMASDDPEQEIVVGFNEGFLDDFVDTFNIQALTVEFIRTDHKHPDQGHVLRPILIHTPEDPDMTGLLMPIRVGDMDK